VNCNCPKSIVCKCAVYEDDLNWAKAIGLVGVILAVVFLGIPRAYQWFKAPAVSVVQTHITSNSVLPPDEIMRVDNTPRIQL
jgi:hypothetical protein